MKIGILSDTHMIKECIDKTIPYLKDGALRPQGRYGDPDPRAGGH